MADPEWFKSALCKGRTSVMFLSDSSATAGRDSLLDSRGRQYGPSKGVRQAAEQAKAICRECPVIEPCLDFALTNREQFGVWGGLAWYERRRVLKDRKARTA